ncbi:disulfide bond formation protein DsbA [Rhizobium sp. JAB6]|jgi:protein-disulfide isomerase|uniref:DsbA family protein n=1 Tax=Rhizobium sp. JAB6 TaxID=2127050 RepID=UPI000D133561|nr:DsbA family protein [Rhizobium sp. JAB6]PST21232.1 disulfide bond formation protein DsbA [Rhizobium sp. JAB6]
MTLSLKSLLTVTAIALTASFATIQPAAALDDQQKKEIGDFIRDYLVEHPEVLLDAQAALEKKQDEARIAQSSQVITENKDAIFNSKDDVAIGNPKGDITVVEFFDYNCTYCRHALGDMDKLLQQDKNVRFVLKEFPILGQDSVAASRVSSAFRLLAPEKYAAFHHKLLSSEGRASEDAAIDVATSLGVSEAAIRAEMAKAPNTATIKATYQLATDLGVNGTPAYVIGNEMVSGAIGLDAIKEKIANVRGCGKTSC